MPLKLKLVAALLGALALLGAVGVNVAQAGSYPSGGTYHGGGDGTTVEPSPDPTTLTTASFSPPVTAEPPCGAIPWGGGCC